MSGQLPPTSHQAQAALNGAAHVPGPCPHGVPSSSQCTTAPLDWCMCTCSACGLLMWTGPQMHLEDEGMHWGVSEGLEGACNQILMRVRTLDPSCHLGHEGSAVHSRRWKCSDPFRQVFWTCLGRDPSYFPFPLVQLPFLEGPFITRI